MNEGTCFQDIRSIMNGRYDGEEGGGAVLGRVAKAYVD